jgi:hypothetical protein
MPMPVPAGLSHEPARDVQPTYAESGTPTAAYADAALPDSQILDKWKDSGKPLR